MVNRNPTHTDQYLQCDSHHAISAKCSEVGILNPGAKAVCSNHQLLQQVEGHLQEIMTKYRYAMWALKRVRIKNSPH